MQSVMESPQATEVFGSDEGQKLFDATAERYFNISGREFLANWDAGRYSDPGIRTRAMRVALLIPMVRSVSARKNSR